MNFPRRLKQPSAVNGHKTQACRTSEHRDPSDHARTSQKSKLLSGALVIDRPGQLPISF